MKKDSLAIDGKIYLSSRRAAEIAGYSKDYIGQLCRSGKLVCRTVGRLWYVDEVSLRKHQAESFKANQTSFRPAGFETSPIPKESLIADCQPSISTAISDGPKFDVPVNEQISFSKDNTFGLFFNKALILFMAVMAIIAGGVTALSTNNTGLRQNLSKSIVDNSASVYSAINSTSDLLRSALNKTYSNLAFVVDPSSKSVSSIPADESNRNDNTDAAHAGLVVVPDVGSSTSENEVKLAQTITNSFSDNVTVTPGKNGTTGVITPEFRTVKGHDYLYVLVPVKTSSSSPTSVGSPTNQN